LTPKQQAYDQGATIEIPSLCMLPFSNHMWICLLLLYLEMISQVFYSLQKFQISLSKLNFLRIFEEKMKKNHKKWKIISKNLKISPHVYILYIENTRHWKYNQNSNCNKIFNLKNFSKFQIRVETTIHDLHLISWTQIKKMQI